MSHFFWEHYPPQESHGEKGLFAVEVKWGDRDSCGLEMKWHRLSKMVDNFNVDVHFKFLSISFTRYHH